MRKVTISLVTYNSERYLPDLCDSLHAQTFQDWDMIVVDNNSSDKSVEIIEQYMPRASVSRQPVNLGFSKAHNLIIGWSRSEYVLIINPDIVMQEDCLEQLVATLDEHPEMAGVAPKLMFWDVDAHQVTDVIDSCGIRLWKNYRAEDWLQGQADREMGGQNIFGPSGALALFRKAALDAVKVPTNQAKTTFEYYDEDFFAYKEDVDLAWRLQVAGWQCYFEPRAVAGHHRVVSRRSGDWHGRKRRSAVNRYSYRNHLMMIYKNHYWSLTLRRILPIMLFELKKFIYLVVLDRSSLQGWGDILRLRKKMRAKRKYIQNMATHQAEELARFLR